MRPQHADEKRPILARSICAQLVVLQWKWSERKETTFNRSTSLLFASNLDRF